MPTRQNWFDGWRLFALLALTLLALQHLDCRHARL